MRNVVALGVGIAAAIALVAAEGPAAAQADFPCHVIKNDLDRRACEDRASGKVPVDSTRVEDNWRIVTETSRITDRQSIYLATESKSPVACGRYEDERATLFIRCKDDKTALIIATNCHLTSSDYNDYGKVDIRLDADKHFSVEMTESTSNSSLGLWSGNKSIPLIRKMVGKSRMLASVTPYARGSVVIEFDLAGLEEQLPPLQKACGWK